MRCILLSVNALILGGLLSVYAQEGTIHIPLGWYSMPELARALSNKERTVTCDDQLRQYVALVSLKNRSWDEAQKLLREGLGVHLDSTSKNRWKLTWDRNIVAQEQKWRKRVCEYWDSLLAERMRKIVSARPLISTEQRKELERISKEIRDYLEAITPAPYIHHSPDGTPVEIYPEPNYDEVSLEQFRIPEDLLKKMRLLKDLNDESIINHDIHYEKELVSLFAYPDFILARFHLQYLVASLWNIPQYRLSVQEMVEKGRSLRIVPLAIALQKVPQSSVLLDDIHHRLHEEGLPIPDMNDLHLVYAIEAPLKPRGIMLRIYVVSSLFDRIVIESESFVFDSEAYRFLSQNIAIELEEDDILPPRVVLAVEDFEAIRFWATQLYHPVWEEVRDWVEQALQNTKEALKHPALTVPLDWDDEIRPPVGKNKYKTDSFGGWVYRWAKQTRREVLMLLHPDSHQYLDWQAGTTLSQLFQRNISTPYNKCAMLTLRFENEVLIVGRLNSFLTRVQQIPLASWKRLCERGFDMDYRDMVEYYRSVPLSQQVWWNSIEGTLPTPMTIDYLISWGLEGEAVAESDDSANENEPAPEIPPELNPNIWQVVHLIESLPIDLRTMLFQTGQLLVNLLDLPERSRQSIATALRACISLCGSPYPTSGIFHPRWLFAPREKFTVQPQYDEGEVTMDERPIIKIHLRRVRTPTGGVRLRVRCLPNFGCAVLAHQLTYGVADQEELDNFYKDWLSDNR